jgi:hypothetical protein
MLSLHLSSGPTTPPLSSRYPGKIQNALLTGLHTVACICERKDHTGIRWAKSPTSHRAMWDVKGEKIPPCCHASRTHPRGEWAQDNVGCCLVSTVQEIWKSTADKKLNSCYAFICFVLVVLGFELRDLDSGLHAYEVDTLPQLQPFLLWLFLR